MQEFFKSLKSIFLTGLLVAFPAWLAILLFVKLLVHLEVLVKPIAGAMPKEVDHPLPWSIVAFVAACFIVGLLFHTALGKLVGHTIAVPTMMKCISNRGRGSGKILAAMERDG